MHELLDFGVEIDVALVDLRFVSNPESQDEFDGLNVCQKIRKAMPDVVVVGYSSSFSTESEENKRLKELFKSKGADVVCELSHLTMTPAKELKFQFSEARAARGKDRHGHGSVRKIFIGSSSEGLAVARKLQQSLHAEFEIEIWNQAGAFGLGAVSIEALEAALDTYLLGIFVFTADDEVVARGSRCWAPRDNVVLEAGMFLGRLGRMRTLIVTQSDGNLKLPSDLDGLTTARFRLKAENLLAEIGPTCERIRDGIRKVLEQDPVSKP